jgi:hypothetical protein
MTTILRISFHESTTIIVIYIVSVLFLCHINVKNFYFSINYSTSKYPPPYAPMYMLFKRIFTRTMTNEEKKKASLNLL